MDSEICNFWSDRVSLAEIFSRKNQVKPQKVKILILFYGEEEQGKSTILNKTISEALKYGSNVFMTSGGCSGTDVYCRMHYVVASRRECDVGFGTRGDDDDAVRLNVDFFAWSGVDIGISAARKPFESYGVDFRNYILGRADEVISVPRRSSTFQKGRYQTNRIDAEELHQILRIAVKGLSAHRKVTDIFKEMK